MGLTDRIQNAFNAFMNKDPTYNRLNIGTSYSVRPDRVRLARGNERSIINAVINRIAVDCSQIDVRHVLVDDDDYFTSIVRDDLNNCLTVEANIDQTGRAFIQDAVQSMLDEGVVAMMPVDTDVNPNKEDSYKIYTMRTAKILEWYPRHLKLRAYDDRDGQKKDIVKPKESVSVVENPFYSVMNEHNSTMQRLIRKLNLLDAIDEQSGSGKLDLIIQLPYVIKTDARRAQAEERRKDIESQLSSSKYGIAYTDGTEKIQQLNRPVENNLFTQIEYYTNSLFAQLGITQSILDGSADEQTLNNYYYRTIEPIMSALTHEMTRKFLTKTARTRHHSIKYFRNQFSLVPITQLIKLSDTFTRNEIMTSNEIRQIIGMRPSDDPNADKLRNKNISYDEEEPMEGSFFDAQNADSQELDNIDSQIDELEDVLNHADDSDYLAHYASKYYDPVKAHEYYEEYTKKHRLKGREGDSYSVSSLNDEGKMAYKQIKESLKEERDSTIAGHKSTKESTINSARNSMKNQIQVNRENLTETIKAHSDKMNSDIKDLREELASMSKEEKRMHKAYIQAEIDSLRESNRKARDSLREDYNSDNSKLREDYTNTANFARETYKVGANQAREDYKNKSDEELRNLVDSGEFKKVKKSTSKSKKSKEKSTSKGGQFLWD